MSLKAVHLVFVNALSALCLALGIWKIRDFSLERQPLDLVFGLGAILATGLVIFYGWYFLKKLKSIGYL